MVWWFYTLLNTKISVVTIAIQRYYSSTDYIPYAVLSSPWLIHFKTYFPFCLQSSSHHLIHVHLLFLTFSTSFLQEHINPPSGFQLCSYIHDAFLSARGSPPGVAIKGCGVQSRDLHVLDPPAFPRAPHQHTHSTVYNSPGAASIATASFLVSLCLGIKTYCFLCFLHDQLKYLFQEVISSTPEAEWGTSLAMFPRGFVQTLCVHSIWTIWLQVFFPIKCLESLTMFYSFLYPQALNRERVLEWTPENRIPSQSG